MIFVSPLISASSLIKNLVWKTRYAFFTFYTHFEFDKIARKVVICSSGTNSFFIRVSDLHYPVTYNLVSAIVQVADVSIPTDIIRLKYLTRRYSMQSHTPTRLLSATSL